MTTPSTIIISITQLVQISNKIVKLKIMNHHFLFHPISSISKNEPPKNRRRTPRTQTSFLVPQEWYKRERKKEQNRTEHIREEQKENAELKIVNTTYPVEPLTKIIKRKQENDIGRVKVCTYMQCAGVPLSDKQQMGWVHDRAISTVVFRQGCIRIFLSSYNITRLVQVTRLMF